MNTKSVLKLFTLNNVAIESELREIQKKIGINIGKGFNKDKDTAYYPQFPEKLRSEAALMALHYEIFYCLENSIRSLISERLEELAGPNWWDTDRVPDSIRINARKNRERELKDGVTLRSVEMISYTTFGELGEIIKFNWNIFSDTFKNQQAVESLMSRLNGLRAPIAHCCPLAEDEVLRLQLTMRDWFRQIG